MALRVPVKVPEGDPDQCRGCEGTGLQQGCPWHSALDFERYVRQPGCRECGRAGGCLVCGGTGRWMKDGEAHARLNVHFRRNIERRVVDGKRDGKDKVVSFTVLSIDPCCRYVQNVMYPEFRMDWHSERRLPGLIIFEQRDFVPSKDGKREHWVSLPPRLRAGGGHGDFWNFCPNCGAKVVLTEQEPKVEVQRFKTETQKVEVRA